MRTRARATLCVREYDFQVPYGVVQTNGHHFVAIDEKPLHRFFVNAGIYVLEPDILKLIPRENHFDMPSLFEKVQKSGDEAAVFPLREYWLDIGRIEDYQRAHEDYADVFE